MISFLNNVGIHLYLDLLENKAQMEITIEKDTQIIPKSIYFTRLSFTMIIYFLDYLFQKTGIILDLNVHFKGLMKYYLCEDVEL